MAGIVVAGTTLVDKINEVKKYPKAGELEKIISQTMAVGGCVPNDSVDMKKIAPSLNVYALAKIGRDADGEFIKSFLESAGVNTDMVMYSDTAKTSFTDVISIAGGERTFFTYAGADSELGFEDIDFDAIDAEMFHLGYFLLLDRIDKGDGVLILKELVKRGIKTSIDLVSENGDRYKCVLPCLEYTDNLIVNEIEAGKLADIEPTDENIKAICQKLLDLGVRERVIIHKPDFAVCLAKNGEFTFVPSYELPEGFIKGATGAGDAFCSGSLIKIYQGESDRAILEFGSACAVMALSEKDAVSGLRTEEEIKEFCKGWKRKNICL